MKHPKQDEVTFRLSDIVTAAFNDSINALERAGAIDTKKMRQHYKGVGTKYYDIVTEQMERRVRNGAIWICELFDDPKP